MLEKVNLRHVSIKGFEYSLSKTFFQYFYHSKQGSKNYTFTIIFKVRKYSVSIPYGLSTEDSIAYPPGRAG